MINCVTMEERIHIDDSLLEKMSVEGLAELMVRISSILKEKLHHCERVSSDDKVSDDKVISGMAVELEDKEVWEIPDNFELMKIDDPSEPVNVWEVNILDKMDTSGRPTKTIQKVGAKISQKNMAKMEALRKEWFEAGGDMEGFLEETRQKTDSQWNRVLSVNGISPTITKTEPPMILVCNEVLTNTDPVEIEVELEVSDPKDSPEPLW